MTIHTITLHPIAAPVAGGFRAVVRYSRHDGTRCRMAGTKRGDVFLTEVYAAAAARAAAMVVAAECNAAHAHCRYVVAPRG